MAASDIHIYSMYGHVLTSECGVVGEVVNNDQTLPQHCIPAVLHKLDYLMFGSYIT